MNLKIGIINRLMFLVICLSLIDDVERKKDKGTGLLVDANPAIIAFNVVNDIVGFVTGMDSLIDMFTPSKEDHSEDQKNEEFRNTVTTKLDDLQQSLTRSFQTVDHGIADIKKALEVNFAEEILENALEEDKNYVLEVNRKLNLIESRYEQDFSHIRQGIKNYRDETLNRYVSSIIDNNDLKDLLRDVIFATKLQQGHIFHKNVLDIAVRFLKNEKHHHRECNKFSTQDQLFFFYSYILKTVVKGYTMIVLSYQYLKMKSTDKAFYKERQIEYQNYHKEAIIQITEAAKYYLQTIDTMNYQSSYTCEPQTLEEGKNYFQVMNYASVRPTFPDCSARKIKSSNPNKDVILTKLCNKIFSDHPLVKDLTNSPYYEYKNYSARYTIQNCKKGRDYHLLLTTCPNDLFSDFYLSVRKLSLTPTYCDHNHNEVVTSARFREKEGMIFIEVQCGTFVDGRIDKNSLRWNTTLRDSFSRSNDPLPNHLMIDRSTRSFPLMDYMTPESEFIVGLGFKVVNGFISLEVFSKNIFDSSGLHSYSMSHNYPVSSTEPALGTLPSVVKQQNKIYEVSEPNKYFVKLTESYSPVGPDYGVNTTGGFYQPIVPFFGMTEYKPSIVLPLGGIGLMHKSVPGYAGLLAFKFFTSKQMRYIPNDYAEKLVIKPVNHFLLMMYK